MVAVLVATAISAALHWQNDGLWLQGDAPRNALNGFFFWDLLTSLPANPLAYALSYYARYPAITPVAYPPLFHILEGAAFRATTPSPHVGKLIVLSFSLLAGIYTLAWGRRWIAPIAGWAGACTVLLPGFVRLSNAVLLNVPGTAIGLATLYHFRVWLDTDEKKHLQIASGLGVATLLTYYPASLVLLVALVWILGSSGRQRSRVFWALSMVFLLLAVLVALALPVYLARHVVPLERFVSPDRWALLVGRVASLTGAGWLFLGATGFSIAFAMHRAKGEMRLAVAYLVTFVTVVAIRWSDPRYALVLAPLTVLAAFLGLVVVSDLFGARGSAVRTALLALFLTLSGWSAVTTRVPVVSGLDQVADHLRQHGPHDSVLYSGRYDGVFGAYARALDPFFERRLVLWRKLVGGSNRSSQALAPADVIALLQRESGCRWVAVEVYERRVLTFPDQPLRLALQGPEFEFVRSFQVTADGVARVDLYRFKLPLEAPPPIDLTFPAFSQRVFRNVQPIPSRR